MSRATRRMCVACASLVTIAVMAGSSRLMADDAWTGRWVTDFGLMELVQKDREVTGSYGDGGTIEGTVDSATSTLELTYTAPNVRGRASVVLADGGGAFAGRWSVAGGSGLLRGWREDPQAGAGKAADFSGVWLSSMGTMQLSQEGDRVTGRYGVEGWGTVEGQVRGRRLDLTWKRIRWSGPAYLEQTKDGTRIFGMTEGESPSTWLGMKLNGYDLHAEPAPGNTVSGRTEDGMLYHVHMPKSWKSGQPVDAVVLLHGSNWTTRGMVAVTARNWPSIGERFAVIGVEGQQWASWSEADDLRFNYSYVNWMGRSTYQGYPYTDRESPYLVARAIDELKDTYGLERVFVGGHSQGGFLTCLLHMHFPEKWAGTFPMSAGLVIQAEPDVFDDDRLVEAQRATPMAIVHGRHDNVVSFSTGQYVYGRFLAYDFSNVRFFTPDAGHPYDFLPVGDAVEWLDMMSTADGAALAAYAHRQAEAENWRALGALVHRARSMEAADLLAGDAEKLNRAAGDKAEMYLRAIRADKDGAWVDGYLEWQEQFAAAPAAQETIEAYRRLRSEHDAPAKQLVAEARQAFRAGNRDEARRKYQEIVDRYYASHHYPTARQQTAR